jgi:hypothetical protein
LEILAVDDAHNAVASSLCFRSDDGNTFADEGVHESRFAYVRVANDVDKASFVCHIYKVIRRFLLIGFVAEKVYDFQGAKLQKNSQSAKHLCISHFFCNFAVEIINLGCLSALMMRMRVTECL